MEIISIKSNARKMLTKQKGIYNSRDRLIGTLFRMSVLPYFFINRIFYTYIYISANFWDFSYFIFFKFKVKLIKPSRTHAWSTVEKMLISLFPQFSMKTLKTHLLKTWFTWLVYISLNFLPKICWYITPT